MVYKARQNTYNIIINIAKEQRDMKQTTQQNSKKSLEEVLMLLGAKFLVQ